MRYANNLGKHTAILMVLTLVAGLICFVSSTSLAQGKILMIADLRDPTTLDPAKVYDGSDRFTYQVYETLARVKDATGAIEPWLAESYKVSEDGKVYTFKLRKGIKFHDGYDFNAEAVKFSFDRMLKINKGLAWAFKSLIDSDSITVLDDYTVRFFLKKPYPGFLGMVASRYGAPIISPGVMKYEKDGDLGQEWAQNHTIGTGPYMLNEWVAKQRVDLVKNPDYWRGWEGDHYERVVFMVVPDGSSRKMMLENGDVQMTYYLGIDQYELLEKNPDIEVVKAAPGESVFNYFILLNTRKGVMANPKVREAVSWAFPYQETIDSVMKNYASGSIGPLPAAMPNHNKDLFVYRQDIAKARELMAEAGYPEGGFEVTVTYSSSDAYNVLLLQLLTGSLGELGITVKAQPLTWGAMVDKMMNQETAPDMTIADWWPDYPDPDSFLRGMTDYFLWGAREEKDYYYYNEELKELLDKAAFESDQEKRKQMYDRAQEIMVADNPAIWVFDNLSTVAINKNLKGLKLNPHYTMIPDIYELHPAN